MKSISSGILPLSFRVRPDYQDRALTTLLLSSLSKHWKGISSFSLTVVVPDDEIADISAMEMPSNLRSCLITERELLGVDYPIFMRMDWWRRQQIIKILAAASHDFEAAIVLSSDVVCIGDFDETTFIQGGQIRSDWEPKSGQAWWPAASRLLGIDDSGFDEYGLSVVPNTISRNLWRSNLDYISKNIGSLPTLLSLSRRIVPESEVAWTDFSLYTLLGEVTGQLLEYHIAPKQAFASAPRVRSDFSVWEVSRLVPNLQAIDLERPDGVFICIQSSLRIKPDTLRKYLVLQ